MHLEWRSGQVYYLKPSGPKEDAFDFNWFSDEAACKFSTKLEWQVIINSLKVTEMKCPNWKLSLIGDASFKTALTG